MLRTTKQGGDGHRANSATSSALRDNYFQEQRARLMCLAVVPDNDASIIGNVQQQNFHVLYDVQDNKFLFAPTCCDDI